MKMFVGLESFAGELAAFGREDIACVIRETIRRVREEEREFWNTPLTVREAAEWGGYSESQLRRLAKEYSVPLASEGNIRRRHVPVKPGHVIPLSLDPVESSEASWRERMRQQREAS